MRPINPKLYFREEVEIRKEDSHYDLYNSRGEKALSHVVLPKANIQEDSLEVEIISMFRKLCPEPVCTILLVQDLKTGERYFVRTSNH